MLNDYCSCLGMASPGRLVSCPLPVASPACWPLRGLSSGLLLIVTSVPGFATRELGVEWGCVCSSWISMSATCGHSQSPTLFSGTGIHCPTGKAHTPQAENQIQSPLISRTGSSSIPSGRMWEKYFTFFPEESTAKKTICG